MLTLLDLVGGPCNGRRVSVMDNDREIIEAGHKYRYRESDGEFVYVSPYEEEEN